MSPKPFCLMAGIGPALLLDQSRANGGLRTSAFKSGVILASPDRLAIVFWACSATQDGCSDTCRLCWRPGTADATAQ